MMFFIVFCVNMEFLVKKLGLEDRIKELVEGNDDLLNRSETIARYKKMEFKVYKSQRRNIIKNFKNF